MELGVVRPGRIGSSCFLVFPFDGEFFRSLSLDLSSADGTGFP